MHLVQNAQDLAIIHGPPGTGKTTTLVQCILHTLHRENQVLVCAPSNTAVDLLVEKISDHGVQVLRIGHPARVTPEFLSCTLDAYVSRHPLFPQVKSLRIQAENCKKQAYKHKRNYSEKVRQQKRSLHDEVSRLRNEAYQLENDIIQDIVSKVRVIACTLVGAANPVIRFSRFKTVFMDEAAQAMEPAAWIPLLKTDRIIFAGDHWQLPPTIRSLEAIRQGLQITLFEKAIGLKQASHMLQIQYRMNSAIMAFPSSFFYQNKIVAHPTVSDRTLFTGDSPLEFLDTAGCNFYEQTDSQSDSTFNTEEALLMFRHFQSYIDIIQSWNALDDIENIGIITPYRAQVELLKETFNSTSINANIRKKITINTVDAFQGQERDIIYISLVRCNTKGQIGFLSDTRRMNVAITRAKKKLVIVGDSSTIRHHPFYAKFLEFVQNNGVYRSAFEWIQD